MVIVRSAWMVPSAARQNALDWLMRATGGSAGGTELSVEVCGVEDIDNGVCG